MSLANEINHLLFGPATHQKLKATNGYRQLQESEFSGLFMKIISDNCVTNVVGGRKKKTQKQNLTLDYIVLR